MFVCLFSLVPIPEEVNVIIWTHVIYMSNRTFVEGYVISQSINLHLDGLCLILKINQIACAALPICFSVSS